MTLLECSLGGGFAGTHGKRGEGNGVEKELGDSWNNTDFVQADHERIGKCVKCDLLGGACLEACALLAMASLYL